MEIVYGIIYTCGFFEASQFDSIIISVFLKKIHQFCMCVCVYVHTCTCLCMYQASCLHCGERTGRDEDASCPAPALCLTLKQNTMAGNGQQAPGILPAPLSQSQAYCGHRHNLSLMCVLASDLRSWALPCWAPQH